MDRTTKIALLRRKAELLAENTYSQGSEDFARKLFTKILDHAVRFPRMPETALNELDREMERMMSHFVLKDDYSEVRDPLIAEFGTSRITVSTKAIMRRVLKRGSVATEDEYYQIQEIVTNVDNIDRLGPDTYARLDQLAGAFQPKDDRAPRPRNFVAVETSSDDQTPRWPMVPPEGDDHVCPAGTSLAVLEQFVRTKLTLLLQQHTDPDAAAGLSSMIESGIRHVTGPSIPPEKKDFKMRFRDHELEAFSGLEITLPVLRAVEDELQAQFGFRRLLPSPRRLGLQALETDEAGDMWIRLIIERALANYTAPPIYSPAEVKALNRLLKRKPASQT
jgi:hypothetical protein